AAPSAPPRQVSAPHATAPPPVPPTPTAPERNGGKGAAGRHGRRRRRRQGGGGPAASPQHGAQQQAGLGVDHTVDRADAAQHVVEGGQVGAGDLGDQVPAAVGGVQGLDLGEAAQVHDHAVGAAALDLDEGGRTHGRGLGVVAHPHREAHDHAGGG